VNAAVYGFIAGGDGEVIVWDGNDGIQTCAWRIHKITRQSVSGTARDRDLSQIGVIADVGVLLSACPKCP
jgi:hypothetical protein